jgi:hypothetical protein
MLRRIWGFVRAQGIVGFARRLQLWLSEQRHELVVRRGTLGLPRLARRYDGWMRAHTLDAQALARRHAATRQMTAPPVISLISPVFTPPTTRGTARGHRVRPEPDLRALGALPSRGHVRSTRRT